MDATTIKGEEISFRAVNPPVGTGFTKLTITAEDLKDCDLSAFVGYLYWKILPRLVEERASAIKKLDKN